MPAHRRNLRLDPAPSQPRVAAGRRRAAKRLQHQITLFLSVAIVSGALLVTPAVRDLQWSQLADWRDEHRGDAAALPADAPELGLVYRDLTVASKDAPCAGSYELNSPETCTHGPDQSPPGLVVSRDVPPVAPEIAAPAPLRRETESPPKDAEVALDQGGITPDNESPALVPDAAPGDEPFAVGDSGVACATDGRTGKRIQALYLYQFGTPSRYAQYLRSFRAWAGGVDRIFAASAAETGGVRRLRYVTTPQCQLDVAEVQVPAGALDSLKSNIAALEKLGYNRTDRKYLIFADDKTYCGISTVIGDRRPGPGNRNNAGPSYARTDAGCWSAAVAAHELAHTLGAVLDNAPHSTKEGHCTDGYDLMCYEDSPNSRLRVLCPEKDHQRRLDCNHDDYFHTNPKPGSFLATNWNVADSDFLLREADHRGQAVLPTPGPSQPASAGPANQLRSEPAAPQSPPATVPPPGPDGTASPAATEPGGSAAPVTPGAADSADPAGFGSAGPATGGSDAPPAQPSDTPSAAASPPAPTPPVAEGPAPLEPILQTSEITSTAVRLVWTPTESGTNYAVTVNGRVLATTEATRARLIGLRPGTRYVLGIRLTGARDGPYTPPAEVRTAPAAQPSPGSWFVLANSLTNSSADLYAARSAATTPLVLNRTEGGAQQLWRLRPAGNGSFQMVSKASEKCVIPLRSNPVAGTPLVQGDCSEGDTRQNWWIEPAEHGFTLRTALGDLVVGLGTQRFGGSRVLVLQAPNNSRQQSWAALPG